MDAQMMFFRDHGGPVGPRSVAERIWLWRRMRWVARDIAKDGWTVVPFQLSHDAAPRFFYTVGFSESLGQPEMIVCDTPFEQAAAEFNTAFEGLRSGELTLSDGQVWSEQGAVRCILRRVHPSQITSWLGLAAERHRRMKGDAATLAAFQLVLPDKAGFLPWEPGYSEEARTWQPALYEPRGRA
jgi:hypothetical protein